MDFFLFGEGVPRWGVVYVRQSSFVRDFVANNWSCCVGPPCNFIRYGNDSRILWKLKLFCNREIREINIFFNSILIYCIEVVV